VPERHFRRARPATEDIPWGSLDPSKCAPAVVEFARGAWTEVAINEYRAVASFCEVRVMGGGICTIQNASHPYCELRLAPIRIPARANQHPRLHDGEDPSAASSTIAFHDDKHVRTLREPPHDAMSTRH
jgi:hypothetical protein